LADQAFWRDSSYSRTYTTTVGLDGSAYSFELTTIPQGAVRKTALREVTFFLRGGSKPGVWMPLRVPDAVEAFREGARVQSLPSGYSLQASELVGLLCLLGTGELEGNESLEQAVAVGLNVAGFRPDLRRLADSVVHEPLVLVEASPAQRVTLAAAIASGVGASAGILVHSPGVVSLILALGSGSLVLLKQSAGCKTESMTWLIPWTQTSRRSGTSRQMARSPRRMPTSK
jgi:hypothetical protein